MRWGWVDELHDQLRERVVDGERGGIGSEREQHEPCVRGDEPSVHGELQWICERGRDERVERGAGIDDGRGDEQSCGQLRDNEQPWDIGGDELLVSLTNGLLTVGPVGLTLSASNQAKVYGQTLSFAGTEFGVSGLVKGDSVSVASLSSAGAAAGAGVAGSPYSIVITNAVGNGLTNYTISYVNGLLTVNAAALGVSANNTNRAYGATNPVFTVSYNGFVNGDGMNVLSGAPALTTGAVTNSPVGNYVITNSLGTLVATNYLVSLTNGLLTVGPVGLTLSASNQAKVYGQTLSFAGTEFGVSGLVNGDSVSVASLSSAGSAAGAAVGGSPYSIVITNAVGMG